MLAFRDVKLMSMCWYKGMVSASCQVTRPSLFLVDLKPLIQSSDLLDDSLIYFIYPFHAILSRSHLIHSSTLLTSASMNQLQLGSPPLCQVRILWSSFGISGCFRWQVFTTDFVSGVDLSEISIYLGSLESSGCLDVTWCDLDCWLWFCFSRGQEH